MEPVRGQRSTPPVFPLVAQSQVFDQLPVPLQVGALQILQKAPTPPDHFEQSLSAVMVVLVLIEVCPQMVDPRGEEGDLDGGASTIRVVELVLLDDLFFVDAHVSFRASTRDVRYKGSPGLGARVGFRFGQRSPIWDLPRG